MSYWRAYATACNVADCDLRVRLIEALETLHAVAEALDVDPDNYRTLGLPISEDDLVRAAKELHDDAKNAREEAEKSNDERVAAEAKLEAVLQEDPDYTAAMLRVELEIAKKDAARDREERDAALARLANSEDAGVPTKHVRRPVKGYLP
jgi:hypothetical protein